MALYRHRFSGTCAAGDIFVFTWWSDSSLSTEQANSAAATWADEFWNGTGTTPAYADMVTADVALTQVSTGEIDIATGRQQTLAETAVNYPGLATGSALPADCAIVVTLRSIVANRSGRGRFYLPQPAVSTTTALGRISGTAQADILAAAIQGWSSASAAGLTPVVYSRTYSRTSTITQAGVGNLFDTQRSRENQLVESRVMEPMP